MNARSFAIGALVAPIAAIAQTRPSSFSLDGSTLAVVSVTAAGERTDHTALGGRSEFTGGLQLSVSHFINPNFGIEVATGAFAGRTWASAGTHSTDFRIPMLVGGRVAPNVFSISRHVRPYLSLLAGPYMTAATTASATEHESSLQIVPGGRAGLGIQWFLFGHALVSFESTIELTADQLAGTSTLHHRSFGFSVGAGLRK